MQFVGVQVTIQNHFVTSPYDYCYMYCTDMHPPTHPPARAHTHPDIHIYPHPPTQTFTSTPHLPTHPPTHPHNTHTHTHTHTLTHLEKPQLQDWPCQMQPCSQWQSHSLSGHPASQLSAANRDKDNGQSSHTPHRGSHAWDILHSSSPAAKDKPNTRINRDYLRLLQ